MNIFRHTRLLYIGPLLFLMKNAINSSLFTQRKIVYRVVKKITFRYRKIEGKIDIYICIERDRERYWKKMKKKTEQNQRDNDLKAHQEVKKTNKIKHLFVAS